MLAISKERSSTERSFHADGPTTETALRCTVAKWARGTKISPLAAPDALPKPTLSSRGHKGKRGGNEGHTGRLSQYYDIVSAERYIVGSQIVLQPFPDSQTITYGFLHRNFVYRFRPSGASIGLPPLSRLP